MSIYKSFGRDDIFVNRSLLHEAIPLTGSIVSGTYSDLNIKNYAHGRFQSVYDFPYLSSSANNIFDITMGYHADSSLSGTTTTTNINDKKIQMYNLMAQKLMGFDVTGSILKFDADGNLADGGTKFNNAFFLCFSRLLYKDEIKKGSFTLTLGTASNFNAPFGFFKTINDSGAQNDYRVNARAGEYGILKDGSSNKVGLIFYQAGVVMLDPTGALPVGTAFSGGLNVSQQLASGSISGTADALRNRIYNISFNNTTELNHSIYMCRMSHNEYNYSSNPTYVSGSKIVVKNNQLDNPVSYVTTVGIYSADNELLAVGKLSEPLKKDPTTEKVIRMRLDF